MFTHWSSESGTQSRSDESGELTDGELPWLMPGVEASVGSRVPCSSVAPATPSYVEGV